MCGICGEIRWDGEPSNIEKLALMTHQMKNRGPNGGGVVQFGRVALGQRRLSIFDLSDHAQQPMIDNQLGLSIVFNGAIYNYLELKSDLEARGYSFFSHSDTEVLLKGFHAWGSSLFAKLQGMFALCIWERDSGKIILARDRLGIKPLYYSVSSKSFQFASTVSALLHNSVDTTIDPIALQYFMIFHAIPDPLTIYKGIRKLAPGTILTLSQDGKMETCQYWSVTFRSDIATNTEKISEEDWLTQLRRTLSRSIKRRLTADVPVGVLLSGGLDSSLIVGLASDELAPKIKTFSIGFESSLEESGNEFYYSDMIANIFGTQHHKISIENSKLFENLENCIAAMSEPMTSHDNIGFYLLSQEVAKHVNVVQSGQGADELFAGYSWFQNSDFQDNSYEDSAKKLWTTVADRTYEEFVEAINPNFITSNFASDFLLDLCMRNGSRNRFDHLQQYEATFALTNGPLARVDNMTMAWGLEARVPFLDHELVELVSIMPSHLKTPDGGKYILKKLARGLIPDEVIDRKKGYFPVPALRHFGDHEIQWISDILSPNRIRDRGILDPKYVQMLLSNPNKYRTPSGASKIWQLVILESWLQSHQAV